jgi:hypothetical protein
MSKSTACLERLLEGLTRQARLRGLNDSAWAASAGLRKETLSRLRTRGDCDLNTLCALAQAIGAQVAIAPASAQSAEGHFPDRYDRHYEEGLVDLCASGMLDPAAWRATGPAFFMAGVAVMLASVRGFDRGRYLGLAETLHPGSSHVDVFNNWLVRTPVAPSRFLPMLEARLQRAG